MNQFIKKRVHFFEETNITSTKISKEIDCRGFAQLGLNFKSENFTTIIQTAESVTVRYQTRNIAGWVDVGQIITIQVNGENRTSIDVSPFKVIRFIYNSLIVNPSINLRVDITPSPFGFMEVENTKVTYEFLRTLNTAEFKFIIKVPMWARFVMGAIDFDQTPAASCKIIQQVVTSLSTIAISTLISRSSNPGAGSGAIEGDQILLSMTPNKKKILDSPFFYVFGVVLKLSY